ncbi:MAG: fibronectin type III domain-containing protein [Candidatus Zixiibacteriota bacterium]|nr:MAG: fibronectin type III domain-containing protein [candidate division Zixibacteria bacterium]
MRPDFSNASIVFRHCYLSVVLALIFTLTISLSLFAQEEAAPVDSLAVDSLALADTPLPPTNIVAEDQPHDGGGAITVTWDASPDDFPGGKVKGYKIFRAEYNGGQPGEFTEVGDVPAGKPEYSNEDGNTTDGVLYVYKIAALNRAYGADGDLLEYLSDSQQSGPVTSSAQWFHMPRINVLVAVVLLSFFIVYFIQKAKTGKELYIRRIAGMEAVDEAVGRATEMGKKIFYITGLGDMDNMQTIASMTILGRVAELAAEYETYLDVPVCRSLVMVTGREVVKESYSKAGRPDAFKPDQVHYLTDDQFGYAAAVDGMFVREEPATIFYMGQFFAESLILAETGNSIGAIQIAGTAMPAQLPFFVAACDYTLIGEELFAASAYLSKEPKLLGSLKGQDIGKGVILLALIIGVLLESFGVWQLSNLFMVK